MSDAEHNIKQIYQAAVNSINPEKILSDSLSLISGDLIVANKKYHLEKYENIYVVGAGKSAESMALSLEKILRHHIKIGVVAVNKKTGLPLSKILVMEAGHPTPNENSLKATKTIMNLLSKLTRNDLVIFLFSGGAQTILFDCPDNISLQDVIETNHILFHCGATPGEINCIRNHLSEIKGGRIVKKTGGAEVISFIINDSLENNDIFIGSSPTVADDSTFADAQSIISKYKIEKALPTSVINYLAEGANGKISESLKQTDKIYGKVSNYILSENRTALDAAEQKAAEMGYETIIVTRKLTGETKLAAKKWISEMVMPFKGMGRFCLLAGGNTSVTLLGGGTGGRNQEFAMACAMELSRCPHITVLAARTDGSDGPTNMAGAIVSSTTISRARKMKLDPDVYLQNNDSFKFFKKVGGHVNTGHTHTNSMDLILTLVN